VTEPAADYANSDVSEVPQKLYLHVSQKLSVVSPNGGALHPVDYMFCRGQLDMANSVDHSLQVLQPYPKYTRSYTDAEQRVEISRLTRLHL
jgi:hypothetical protein